MPRMDGFEALAHHGDAAIRLSSALHSRSRSLLYFRAMEAEPSLCGQAGRARPDYQPLLQNSCKPFVDVEVKVCVAGAVRALQGIACERGAHSPVAGLDIRLIGIGAPWRPAVYRRSLRPAQ